MVNQGGAVRGRMVELSAEGCRVRTEGGHSQGVPAGIEVMFRMNGIAFRLGGTMQWVDGQRTAGIEFSPMAPRRREALDELLAELEGKEQGGGAEDDTGQETSAA